MDKRQFGFFQLDNAIIDRHIKAIGGNGLSVYSFLVRWSYGRLDYSVSILTIAQALGLSPKIVVRALKTLQTSGIVSVEKKKSLDGGNLPNTYILNHLTLPPKGKSSTPITEIESPQKGNAYKEEEVKEEENNIPLLVFDESQPEIPDLIKKASSNITIQKLTADLWDEYRETFRKTPAYKLTPQRAKAGVELVSAALGMVDGADEDKAWHLLGRALDALGRSDWHRQNGAFDWEKNFCRNADRWLSEAQRKAS